jgi:hypothetical protein
MARVLIIIAAVLCLFGCAAGRGCWGGSVGEPVSAAVAEARGGAGKLSTSAAEPRGERGYVMFLNGMGALCMLIGVGTAIAGTIVPIVSRRTSGVAVGCAVGCWVLAELLGKWMPALVIGGLLVGLALAAPVVVTWVRLQLKRRAEELEDQQDERAAVALRVAAEPRRFRTKKARKQALKNAEASRV